MRKIDRAFLKKKSSGKKTDILVVGHCTHDVIVNREGRFYRLGGPPAYMSSLFRGLNINYDIISKVGFDFKYLSSMHKKPIMVPKTPTTCFVNDYSGPERVQKVKAICEPIYPEDINQKTRIAIISGVVGEFLPETIKKIAEVSDKVFCDVQGLIRKTNEQGDVYEVDISKTPFSKCLKYLDFLSMSDSEVRHINTENMKTTLLIVHEKTGCTVIKGKEEITVPTQEVKTIDSTGAGDMFLGAFAYCALQNKSLEDCAKKANKYARLTLGSVGVPKINPKEVL